MAAIHVNNATTAYFRTGIYPLNPYLETWEEAIHGLGEELRMIKTNMGIKNNKRDNQWEVQVIKKEEGRPELTKNKKNFSKDMIFQMMPMMSKVPYDQI